MHLPSFALDTIVAPATPPGRGGIAVVRVSGPKVKQVTAHLLQQSLAERVAKHANFYDQNHQLIDTGIAIFFCGPKSFTGEDVVEFHVHGGPVIVDHLIETILTHDVRLAKPGEFSERAFLNGKLDLAQAEGIADMINATSRQAAAAALRSLQGDFSREINAVCEALTEIRIYTEAAIDFSDEDISLLGVQQLLENCEKLIKRLNAIFNLSQQGILLREGFSAIIMGAPNVGKSSLLNLLCQAPVAIVTDIPGTTRDLLKTHLLLDGIPLHLMDTAGIRESDDLVEKEGIKRAYAAMQAADIVLYVTAGANQAILPEIMKNAQNNIITIKNKIDLDKQSPTITTINGEITVSLSAKTGEGIDLLKAVIKEKIGWQVNNHGIFLARRRHLDALKRAIINLQTAHHHFHDIASLDLAAEELRLAQQSLGEILGTVSADDLLGKIFSSFCIGK